MIIQKMMMEEAGGSAVGVGGGWRESLSPRHLRFADKKKVTFALEEGWKGRQSCVLGPNSFLKSE